MVGLYWLAKKTIDLLVHEIDQHFALRVGHETLNQCEWSLRPPEGIHKGKGWRKPLVCRVNLVKERRELVIELPMLDVDLDVRRQSEFAYLLLQQILTLAIGLDKEIDKLRANWIGVIQRSLDCDDRRAFFATLINSGARKAVDVEHPAIPARHNREPCIKVSLQDHVLHPGVRFYGPDGSPLTSQSTLQSYRSKEITRSLLS